MKYTVEIFRLPPSVRVRTYRALVGLEETPRPAGCAKMQGSDDLWKIRIGVYRVVYRIDDCIRVVRVERVGHRSAVYK